MATANPSKRQKASSSTVVSVSTSETTSGREAILKAALAEFSDLGYDGTSIRRIARRADVDFTLVTYYFKTKENLWQQVVIKGASNFQNQIENHMAALRDLTPGETLKQRFLAEYTFASSSESLFHLVMNEYRVKGPRSEWLYENFIAKARYGVTQLIEDAQESGEVVEGHPLMLYKLMQVGVRSLIMSREEFISLTGTDPKDQTLLDEFWALFERVFFPAVKTS
jgi:AcrR family transcriptional regulator